MSRNFYSEIIMPKERHKIGWNELRGPTRDRTWLKPRRREGP